MQVNDDGMPEEGQIRVIQSHSNLVNRMSMFMLDRPEAGDAGKERVRGRKVSSQGAWARENRACRCLLCLPRRPRESPARTMPRTRRSTSLKSTRQVLCSMHQNQSTPVVTDRTPPPTVAQGRFTKCLDAALSTRSHLHAESSSTAVF